jgi:hypothetical protein
MNKYDDSKNVNFLNKVQEVLLDLDCDKTIPDDQSIVTKMQNTKG